MEKYIITFLTFEGNVDFTFANTIEEKNKKLLKMINSGSYAEIYESEIINKYLNNENRNNN